MLADSSTRICAVSDEDCPVRHLVTSLRLLQTCLSLGEEETQVRLVERAFIKLGRGLRECRKHRFGRRPDSPIKLGGRLFSCWHEAVIDLADHVFTGLQAIIVGKVAATKAEHYECEGLSPSYSQLREAMDFLCVDARGWPDLHNLDYWVRDEHQPSVTPILDDLDGPIPPNKFRYAGKTIELEPIPWRLLDFLWPRKEPVEEENEDMLKHVWGKDIVSPGAVRNAVVRCNNAFTEAGIPCTIERKSGWVQLLSESVRK